MSGLKNMSANTSETQTPNSSTYFPQQSYKLIANLSQRLSTKFVREQQYNGLPTTSIGGFLTRINRQLKSQVNYGPFAGMKYVSESIGSAHYPKLLGTYELELHPIIEELCNINFDRIINVGAGEGYYSIGLALRNHQAEIIAFESDNKGRKLIQNMVELNGIGKRLSLHGECDIISLQAALKGAKNPLIFMDCEGEEGNLLDPSICQDLRDTTIVVELHPFNFPQVDDIIAERFQDTHKITEIRTRQRRVSDFPIKTSILSRLLFKDDILNILNENRQIEMSFFYLQPKT
jgi:hypothetical protein